MHSLESLRAIREMELFLFGGCSPPPSCDCYGSGADYWGRVPKVRATPPKGFGKEGEIGGLAIFDLNTREIRSFTRNEIALYRNRGNGRTAYHPIVTHENNPEWERFDMLVLVKQ